MEPRPKGIFKGSGESQRPGGLWAGPGIFPGGKTPNWLKNGGLTTPPPVWKFKRLTQNLPFWPPWGLGKTRNPIPPKNGEKIPTPLLNFGPNAPRGKNPNGGPFGNWGAPKKFLVQRVWNNPYPFLSLARNLTWSQGEPSQLVGNPGFP